MPIGRTTRELEPARHDRELIERAKRDPREFGALYDRYFLRIYKFVYSRVRDQNDAEDITAEVFTRSLKAMPNYEDAGHPFSAWLFHIAANLVIDRSRASNRWVFVDDPQDVPVAGPPLDELVADRVEMSRIWDVVEMLPEHQRVSLVLKFRHDMRIVDIARAMGKTPGAVKVLIHRSLVRLRSELLAAGVASAP
jgi:RNA polymerase sigma-70 factor (ECF subfamily)